MVSFAFNTTELHGWVFASDLGSVSYWDEILECVDAGVMIERFSKDGDEASEAGIER